MPETVEPIRKLIPDLVIIYGLADPRSPDQIRYVGKTTETLSGRLNGHIRECKRRRTIKNNWILKLASEGVKPAIFPLEFCGVSDWIEKEVEWIAFLKQRHPLKNICPGGESGPSRKGAKLTPEQVEKIREVSKANFHLKRDAMWAASRKVWTGRKHRPESIEKNRQSKIGKIPWHATKRAAEANRGKPRPQWLKDHLQKANLARTKPRAIRCVETGQVFRTYRDAAIFLGVKPDRIASAQGDIGNVVRGKRKSTKGYRFEKADWKGD